MSWIDRGLDYVRRNHRQATTLPQTVVRTGMDRFREQTPAQLQDTAMRLIDDNPVMCAVCDALRGEEKKAMDGIENAHRRRVSSDELRTIVGELVGVRNVIAVLMAWVEKGRQDVERAARRQRSS